MTVSTSKNGMKSGTRTDGSASSPEPPAPGLVTATSIHGRGDLTDLPVPHYLFVTPFWFRVFVAGLVAFAAVMVFFALTHALLGPATASDPGGSPRTAVGVALAVLLCGMAFRFCNPLDRRKWFRLALSRDGLYFPGRKSSLVLVPCPTWLLSMSSAGTATVSAVPPDSASISTMRAGPASTGGRGSKARAACAASASTWST